MEGDIRRISFWTYLSAVIVLCFFGLAQAQPLVTLEKPTADPTYTTNRASVEISGTVSSDVTLNRIWWTNNSGAEVNAPSWTEWSHTWSFADTVDLVVGLNVITVYAEDFLGGSASDTLTVAYDLPGVVYEGEGTKAKFTFYYGAGSIHLDRFSVNADLSAGPTQFLPPAGGGTDPQDALVKVDVGVAGKPEKINIFLQKVPASAATLKWDPSVSKYYYTYKMPQTTSTKGIVDLQFETKSAGHPYPYPSLKFYVWAINLDFLQNVRASMSAAQYMQFIKSITDFQITIEYGDAIWVGDFPLKLYNYDIRKIELIFNR